jgi:ADP-ribose pyrophosphatase
VLPILPTRGESDPEVLLIRQYRYAAEAYLLEVPAGRLSPGESPAMCARRELAEETGCTAATLQHLTTILTTPGFTDERIHLFAAWGLTRGSTAHEADEFIEVVTLPFSAVLDLARSGKIVDAKTLSAILYAAQFVVPAPTSL